MKTDRNRQRLLHPCSAWTAWRVYRLMSWQSGNLAS